MTSPMDVGVSLSELNRRKFLLLSVQVFYCFTSCPVTVIPDCHTCNQKIFSQVIQLNDNMSSSSRAAINKSILLGTSSGGSSEGREFNSYVPLDPGASILDKRPITSEHSLLEKQEQIIKLQDAMLEDISKGVDNLKQKVRYLH